MRTIGVVAVVGLASPAAAATVQGTAFLDHDGDGLFSAGDEPIAGALVGFGTSVYATTDPDGAFALTVADGADGIVWVSVPEAGRPGPAWATVTDAAGEVTADVAVPPATATGADFTFVVIADSHMDGDDDAAWTPGDLGLLLDQALATPAPPRFFTIVGDITQANRPGDFAAVDEAFAGIDVPWVPVPGNHDWYDGGAAYRAVWGPDSYSFTTGGVHVIVWNSAMSAAQVRAFVERDLAAVSPSTPVIALGHIPPRSDVALAMRDAGVDALFTGHWHANRVVDHDGLVEYGTQTAVMGGIDLSPAGYRVVDVRAGAVAIRHHTFVEHPVAAIAWPRPDRCVTADGELVAAVEAGPATTRVTARIDGAEIELAFRGGWTWTGPFGGLAEGPHEVTIAVHDALGELAVATATIHVCRAAEAAAASDRPLRAGDWSQLQGGPEHAGAVPDALAIPLATRWAAPVGGHLFLGAPVVAGELVVVTVADFDDGAGGGVVALDLATGAVRWRHEVAAPVRHAPAVAGGVVVFATTTGVVTGLDAGDGAARWSLDLAEGFDVTETALWAPPSIADDTVYVGHQHRLVALDLASGEPIWSVAPANPGDTSGSCAALAVGADDVIGAFHRNSGLGAWSRDGEPRWLAEGPAVQGVNGAVLAVGDRVFVTNVAGATSALDRRTGAVLWTTPLVDAHTWAYASAGAPAYADGRLFVPTQWGRFVALDAATGAFLWSREARPGVLRTAHYRGEQPGFQSSPIVAGDTVWIADTSGQLLAFDAASGARRWTFDLGMPVLGGLAVAGELLIVPTWDGTVRALAPVEVVPTPEAPAGCCSAGGGLSTALAALVLVSLTTASARRRRAAPDRAGARRGSSRGRARTPR